MAHDMGCSRKEVSVYFYRGAEGEDFSMGSSSQVRGKLGEQQQCGLEVGRGGERSEMDGAALNWQAVWTAEKGKKNTAFDLESWILNLSQ